MGNKILDIYITPVMVMALKMVDSITTCAAKSSLFLHSTAMSAVLSAVGTDEDMKTACAITPSNLNI